VAIVIFRSKAAGEIIMLSDAAYPLLERLGKTPGAQGVLTPEELPQAIATLTAAIAEDRATNQGNADAEPTVPVSQRPVTLAQRAFPLLEMLRAAGQRSVPVTWGV